MTTLSPVKNAGRTHLEVTDRNLEKILRLLAI